MIYSLKHRFLFIHIPRTGGTSITEALLRAAHPHAIVDNFDLKHAGAERIREAIVYPQPLDRQWDRLYRFCVVRSPWEIAASDYRNIRRCARGLTWDAPLRWQRDWCNHIRHVATLDFGQFVEIFYLTRATARVRPGGFWPTYCQDRCGRELGVEAIRFEDLSARWLEILARCNLDPIDLPHVNGADPEIPTPWTPDLVKGVGELCCEDVARFGFEPPAEVRDER